MLDPRLALLRDLEPVLAGFLDRMPSVDACWQPSDLLPKTAGEGWREETEALRQEASRLTDEMLVVLIGNIVTEEALPSYQTALNRFGGWTDRTGTETHAWARWSRWWTAEEKRHGDVTRGYLFLSGRVDLKAVERTIQHLLRNGFDTRAEGDPYRGLSYASFQEHATKTCWSQLGTVVRGVGAPLLHRICGLVAADEARHERVYSSMLREVVRRDPAGAMTSIHETLGHSIIMPARTMTDGSDAQLFAHFSAVGHRLGVYTLADYAANLRQLIETLELTTLTGLTGEAARARDAVCELPARFDSLAAERARAPIRPVRFRWIHDRSA